jgi:hypothetical protein
VTEPETRPRSPLRAVALPTEHGGWGLTAEPALLGLLLVPSVAGACLAVAAMLAFLIRTPLRFVLVDRHRGRWLPRTVLARNVVMVEGVALVTLVVVAVLTADAPFWWPAALAAPLVGAELWFDMRSRSRRLVPELAGAVGVCAVAAMIVLAGGHPSAEAAAAWLVLGARATTAIPHVRAQILRMHGRPTHASTLLLADLACVAAATAAVLVEPAMLAGAVAVLGIVAFERATDRRVLPPKVIGIRQTILGLLVVAVTAVGAHLA